MERVGGILSTAANCCETIDKPFFRRFVAAAGSAT
jgi:hypothetical protein